MSEQNKALYRRWVEEVMKKKNLAAIDKFLSPNIVDHMAPPGTPPGIESVKQALGPYLAAFPDMDFTIEDLIAEGDKVVTRYTMRGTHKGNLRGIPPTGKWVTVSGIEITRIEKGKFAEHWEAMDMLGLMQQLGVVKLPGPA